MPHYERWCPRLPLLIPACPVHHLNSYARPASSLVTHLVQLKGALLEFGKFRTVVILCDPLSVWNSFQAKRRRRTSGKRCLPQCFLVHLGQSPIMLSAGLEHFSVGETRKAHRFFGAPPRRLCSESVSGYGRSNKADAPSI